MREIKFRGYGKDVTGEHWIYGNLLDEKLIGLVAIQDEKCHVWEVDPESVGQYTGLLDADGREIYEGDIVKFIKPAYTDVPVVITWEDGAFMVDHDLYLGGRDLSRVTVIGNIYDNLELLERKP